jgi:hypothetical protein
VLVVIMENHSFDQVLSGPRAPWTAGLPAAVLTDWHGIRHPSQPNYVGLFSGSTHGLSDDSCPHSYAGPSLASQLLASGLTFTGYSEGLPAVGSTVCQAGGYKRKHNPWVNFTDLPASVNQPLSALPSDLAQLPTVSIVVPDMCHDTHDCPVSTGDRWLAATIGPYARWAAGHDSLLMLTYDEDDDTAANHIPLLVVGPMVRPGRYAVWGDHYSLLRTLEDLYGLAPLGAAAGRRPLTGIWSAP